MVGGPEVGEDEGEVLERGEAGVEFLEIFILFGALDADVSNDSGRYPVGRSKIAA